MGGRARTERRPPRSGGKERDKPPAPAYTVDALLKLTEDQFRAVLDDDLRGVAHAVTHRNLRDVAVIDRTWSTCLRIHRSIEGQFAAKNAEADKVRTDFARQVRELEDEIYTLERDYDVAIGDGEEQARRELKAALSEKGAELRTVRRRAAEAGAAHASWRAGAVRFKTGLEEDLVRLRTLRDSYRDRLYDTVVVAERDRLAARVRSLEQAIRAHHQHVCTDACDEDGCPADAALWAALGIDDEVRV